MGQDRVELADASLHHSLVVLGGVVVTVLTKVAMGASFGQPDLDLPRPSVFSSSSSAVSLSKAAGVSQVSARSWMVRG